MDKVVSAVLVEMIHRNKGDKKRIEHSVKVYAYAQLLGRREGLDSGRQLALELTAILHDIGISVAEKKYGFSNGEMQELEGPPVAREILEGLSADPSTIDRVCFIISKHHTFSAIDDLDFQLLVEADFLVNSVEEEISYHNVRRFVEKNFKTESGRAVIHDVFPPL